MNVVEPHLGTALYTKRSSRVNFEVKPGLVEVRSKVFESKLRFCKGKLRFLGLRGKFKGINSLCGVSGNPVEENRAQC